MSQEQDSIQIETVIAYPRKELQSESIFTPQIEERKTFEGKKLYSSQHDPILLCSAITATLLVFFIFIQIKKHPLRPSFLSAFFETTNHEKLALSPLTSALQHLLSFITASSLLYFLSKDFFTITPYILWLYIAAGLFVFFIIRTLLVFFTGFAVNRINISVEHYKIMRFLSIQLGLPLFPFIFIALFFPQEEYQTVLYGVLFCFAFKLIAQLFFVYKLLRTSKFSVLHSFLYLCTLEILPIIYLVMMAGYFTSNN